MSVLVEAISVIVRRDAVDERFSGGWEGFLNLVPNNTFCGDGVFVRIGFMTPKDVGAYTSTLEDEGLVFLQDGEALDFAVLDQLQGPTAPAPWLEFGKLETGGIEVSACWQAGQSPSEVALPEGWEYEGSLSNKPGFIANNRIDDHVKFLRRENGIDVYLDLRTGKEVFIGRPSIAGESEEAIFTRLEAICHEVLSIDSKIQAIKDGEGHTPLFSRLENEILPDVQQVAEGAGRQMVFAHFALGLILRVLNRYGEAESALRKANELQPGVINTLLELVLCLGMQGKDREAMAFARESVKVDPIDAGAWGNLAISLLRCGEREEARKAIDYALVLDPQDPINISIQDNFESYLRSS